MNTVQSQAPPQLLLHTVQKMRREPGQSHHMRDDVLCMVLCVVWVIKLSPTHTISECLTVLETESPCWKANNYES